MMELAVNSETTKVSNAPLIRHHTSSVHVTVGPSHRLDKGEPKCFHKSD